MKNHINSKYIEFFGIAGTGKTYTEHELKKQLKNKYEYIFNNREIILYYSKFIIDLNFFEIISLFYFKLSNRFLFKYSKKKNIKNAIKIRKVKKKFLPINTLNFFKKNYQSLCFKIFKKYESKNRDFTKKINYLLKKIPYKKRRQISFWFYELCAARFIYEKLHKQKNIILFNDEAFFCRVFVLLDSTIKNKNKFISKYINLIPKVDMVINLKINNSKLLKIHKDRKKNNHGWYLNKKKLDLSKKIEDKVLKSIIKRRIKLISINNNYKIDKKLFKLLTKFI